MLRDISGLVKATIREACGIEIIPLIEKRESHLGCGYAYEDDEDLGFLWCQDGLGTAGSVASELWRALMPAKWVE